MTTTSNSRARHPRRLLPLAGAMLTGALALSAPAPAAPIAVPAPALPGIAALPGPQAPPSTPAAAMGVLRISPDNAPAGTPFTLSASGLPAGKQVTIVWGTATVSWMLDPRPDSVDYLGRKASKVGVVLATVTTDATGSLSTRLKAPHDFGGIHDVYAVVDGVQVAKGGFLVARTFSITPRRGPVGTPITVTVTGIGSSQYESGLAVLYDNSFTGLATANATRGTARFQIRAAGGVGPHRIGFYDSSHTVPYLNIEQSPLPWQVWAVRTFTVTSGRGVPAARVQWPVDVSPTLDAPTTLTAATGTARATLSVRHGSVGSTLAVSATGLTPAAPVTLAWATVVGSRVNCSGTCWSFASIPLGTATAAADGTLTTRITVPDGLGGWHAIQLLQNGDVHAQAPFFVERSLVGVTPLRLKAGARFEIHLKGVGWTQIDNTVAVDYDNSFIGYGCGFNSNGDVVMPLIATGGPGVHLIDLYPQLYTQNPAYAYPPYGMVPLLSWADDVPGLTLGYRLPAIRVAITIVE